MALTFIFSYIGDYLIPVRLYFIGKMLSIIVDKVSKFYGNRPVFDSISFRIDSGMVYIILGANGSGKTTLIKLLCSLTKPDRGEISIENEGMIKNPEDARDWIGVVSDDVCLYEELTAYENIEFFSRLRGCKLNILEYLERFGLGERAHDPIGFYSSGMKQRMQLAFSILHGPPILLLDEPTVNLDVEGIELVDGIINEWKKNDRVVVMTTNNMEEANRLGDIFLEISGGKITEK